MLTKEYKPPVLIFGGLKKVLNFEHFIRDDQQDMRKRQETEKDGTPDHMILFLNWGYS